MSACGYCTLLAKPRPTLATPATDLRLCNWHRAHRYQCELRLKDGAQLDGEPKFATEPPGSFDFGGQPPIRIALGVPATTKGTQIHSPDELPLLTVMLPSMLATIDTQVRFSQGAGEGGGGG